jgi:hypothetical protein
MGIMSAFLAFLLGSLILLLAAPANAGTALRYEYKECRSDTNYTRGSAFQANLDALLASLPAAAAASSGFARNVTGVAPDQVFGLVQCRADINASVMPPVPRRFGAGLGKRVHPLQFTSKLDGLLRDIIRKAPYSSPRMFAAGMTQAEPFLFIYGMAQCLRHRPRDDCNRCLAAAAAGDIPSCCDAKMGARIVLRICSLRFEVYPFYNNEAVEAAMTLAPSPGKGRSTAATISLLGNSEKPVTLETLSFTKFLRHVFQGRETHNFRKPGTCEASDSRMREIQASWFGEEMEPRTCRSPESRAGDGANFGRWPIRESVGDPVRESRAKTCANLRRSESRSRESVEGLVRELHVKTLTNQRISKVKVVIPKSPGFECELVADL